MKVIPNIIISVLVSLSVFAIAYFTVLKKASNKTAYVQMDKLVYDFKGMKEATDKYGKKMEKWNKEADSLQTILKNLYSKIKLDSVSDKAALKTDWIKFVNYKQAYEQYAQQLQASAGEEDSKMTVGVINQLNEYIKTYGEQNGYAIILCNQPNQPAIGYALESMDITKELLQYANLKYEGGK